MPSWWGGRRTDGNLRHAYHPRFARRRPGGREPFLGVTQTVSARYDLGGECAAFALGHITVELIGIGMTQRTWTRALPLVHSVVGVSPEGDQPDEHPYPVSEAVR